MSCTLYCQLSLGQGRPSALLLAAPDFTLVRYRAAVPGEEADTPALMHLLAAECEGALGVRGRWSLAQE